MNLSALALASVAALTVGAGAAQAGTGLTPCTVATTFAGVSMDRQCMTPAGMMTVGTFRNLARAAAQSAPAPRQSGWTQQCQNMHNAQAYNGQNRSTMMVMGCYN